MQGGRGRLGIVGEMREVREEMINRCIGAETSWRVGGVKMMLLC